MLIADDFTDKQKAFIKSLIKRIERLENEVERLMENRK